MVIKSSGKIVYESDNLHRITNVKNLLEYSDDYSRSVAKNSFWYLDSDRTSGNTNIGFEARKILTQRIGEGGGAEDIAKSINEMIPLNRYSFFQELERKMLPPMQKTPCIVILFQSFLSQQLGLICGIYTISQQTLKLSRICFK